MSKEVFDVEKREVVDESSTIIREIDKMCGNKWLLFYENTDKIDKPSVDFR
ncbi:hypothetical protein AHA02nite_24030 [Alkalibacillus haloalkaliphilus]|uniref:Uncharacterized protein n=1 Tax=Alkalibacillus haloalkaliphilus TaxID=94136 RepID=A0A511W6K7_9BACI|nr:hypothetical protein AHA02nite_24030 [Alkalibacillus haloalkaliphilus]